MNDLIKDLLTLEGKTAIVTGASRGLGSIIALWLARAGAHVFLNYQSSVEAADKTIKAIENEGGRISAARFNVCDSDQVKTEINNIVESQGAIDILVNNAGITRDGLVGRMKDLQWRDVIETNLEAPFFLCREVGKNMIRKRRGRIINITSVAGEIGNGGQVNYSASKAGLIGLTKSLAREFAPRNILVNAVSPGIIQGGMTDQLNEEQLKSIIDHVPLKRLGAPEDVAYAVLYLCSPMAEYITGQVIRVNGGLYM